MTPCRSMRPSEAGPIEIRCTLAKGHVSDHYSREFAVVWSRGEAEADAHDKCGAIGRGDTVCVLKSGHEGVHHLESKIGPPVTPPTRLDRDPRFEPRGVADLRTRIPDSILEADLTMAEARTVREAWRDLVVTILDALAEALDRPWWRR